MSVPVSSGFLTAVTAGMTVLSLVGSLNAGDAAFEIRPGQRQLFLDDVGIEHKAGLHRTMHKLEKRGGVIHGSLPTENIQTRTAPLWDPDQKLFKTWVFGTNDPYRTSPDGLHWQSGPNPEPDIHLRMVVRDPHDPDPSRRYKAAILTKGFSVSGDGIHWTKLDVGAISSSDEGNFSYNPKEGLFIHTVKRSGKYGRSLAAATSTDFQNWTDHGLVFQADDLDQVLGHRRIEARLRNPTLKQTEYNNPAHYSVEIYNMGLFKYEGLFIGMPSMYHHTGKVAPGWEGFAKLRLSPYIQECVDTHGDYTGFYTIQMISSRDMKNWTRQGNREPLIETSPLGGGAYDLQTIIGPSEPVDRGDELWFYYSGIKQYAFVTSGGIPGYDDYVPHGAAICLAVLRKDGFVSLEAEKEGTLLTPPFTLKGDKLFANVRGRKHGELRAEILSSDGTVLARSKPLTGNHMNGRFEWETGSIAAQQDKTVRLHFTLRDGSFYSYWIE